MNPHKDISNDTKEYIDFSEEDDKEQALRKRKMRRKIEDRFEELRLKKETDDFNSEDEFDWDK